MKRFLINLLTITPALIIGYLILKYGVNVPFMDEWNTPGSVIIQADAGLLKWQDFIAQHNESRKLFPRLLLFPLAHLTNWNIKVEMLVSLVLACLVSFNIYYLSTITVQGSRLKKLAYLLLANLLIFSPMQWENWLWGIQIITFVPIACITTSLAIIFSRTRLITKFIVSAILAIIGTFSYANGLLCWLIILPALIAVFKKNKIKRQWLVGGWLLLFILNLSIYFYNYHKPQGHPSFTQALLHPLKTIAYFLSFIGSPLGFQDLFSSQIIGLIILIVFSFCFYLWASKLNNQLRELCLPWLLIGSYTLISGAITAAGRVGFGIEQSLSSRYTTFSVYLIVALIYLLAIISNHLHNKILWSKVIIFLTVAFLLIYPANFVSGTKNMAKLRQERLYGKACLTFINIFIDEDCLKKHIFPELNSLKILAKQIDQIGFLQPSLVTNSNLENLTHQDHFQLNEYGNFDSLSRDNTGNYTTSGWAVLPRKNQPADAVILAYQTSDNSNIAFAITEVKQTRKDVAETFKKQRYTASGWSTTFSRNLIDREAVSISAWAFDSSRGKAYQLANIHNLP